MNTDEQSILWRLYILSGNNERFLAVLGNIQSGESKIHRTGLGPTFSIFDIALNSEEISFLSLSIPIFHIEQLRIL